MSLLHTFPVRTGLVGLWPFFTGTLLDHSGYGHNASVLGGTTPKRSRSGGRLGILEGGLTVANTATLEAITDWSLLVCGELRSPLGSYTPRFLSKRDAGETHWEVFATSTELRVYNGATAVNWVGRLDGYTSMVLTHTNGGTPELYLDGSKKANLSNVITLTTDDAALLLKSLYTGSVSGLDHSHVAVMGLWNRALLASEVAEVHVWSTAGHSFPVRGDRRFFYYKKREAVDEQAAWNCGTVTARTIADTAGGGKHFSLSGHVAPIVTEAGDACAFFGNGYGATASSVTLGSAWTITACARIDASTALYKPIIYTRSGEKGFVLCAYNNTFRGGGGDTTFSFASVVSPVVPLKRMQLVHLTYDGANYRLYLNGALVDGPNAGEYADSGANVYLGSVVGSNFLLGTVGALSLRHVAVSAAVIAEEALAFNRRVSFSEDFSLVPVTLANVTQGQLYGTDYTVGSGSWAVKEDTNGRWLECITAGAVYRRNPFAYGTWEFAVSKTDASSIFIAFVSDQPSTSGIGYRWDFQTTEQMNLFELGAGYLTRSAEGYGTPNTKYTVRVTRTLAGVFTTYVDGVLMDSSAGGTNPVTDTSTTTSAYMVFDCDAGDKLFLDTHFLGVLAP